MNKPRVELYSGTYKNYGEELYRQIRLETYGDEIGQNSWLTSAEYRDFFETLKLSPETRVLEVATGSGGPAMFMVKETGCQFTGIDINENGINNARKLAAENESTRQMTFLKVDASEPMPFADGAFDVILTIDSINHFKNRGKVLKEFNRLLKKGGQLLYTDPVIVTGIVTNEEIALRSSIGFFLFTPAGENERLLQQAGFHDIHSRDVTENIEQVSIKWLTARETRKSVLLSLEGESNFDGIQSFLKIVHVLSSERRLSRFMFIASR